MLSNSTGNSSTDAPLPPDTLTCDTLTDVYPMNRRWLRGRNLNMAWCLQTLHKWQLCNWPQAYWYLNNLYVIGSEFVHAERGDIIFSYHSLCSFVLPARHWTRRCADQFRLVAIQQVVRWRKEMLFWCDTHDTELWHQLLWRETWERGAPRINLIYGIRLSVWRWYSTSWKMWCQSGVVESTSPGTEWYCRQYAVFWFSRRYS